MENTTKTVGVVPARHDLKIVPPFFDDVYEGRKPFEVRKDDRNYQVGDVLHLREWARLPHPVVGECPGYTGRTCFRKVTYKLEGGQFGIQPGYCVLGLGVV